MPVYEYLCNYCGPFTDMRPMSECDDPQGCPRCEGTSPRVILTALKRGDHTMQRDIASAKLPQGLRIEAATLP